jgi:outer membrane protein W
MKQLTTIAFGLLAFGISATALAQDKKFQIGLRTGYALPLGNIYSAGTAGPFRFLADEPMSNAFSGQIPIWLDAGYMVTPDILLGIYAQYGFVSTKTRDAASTGTGCAVGASCSAHDIRFGVQGQYHLGSGQAVDPWLGLGIGYETLGLTETNAGVTTNGSLSGFEFVNLQGGADFKLADAFALGPFVSFSLGQYSTLHTEIQGIGLDIDVPKALHEWLTFGVKGTFGL